MKTSRSDIKVMRQDIKVPNSSFMGFSSTKLCHHDFFVFTNTDPSITGFARSHGVVSTLEDPKKRYILAQVIFIGMTYTGERWINPDDVNEVVPLERVSKHLINLFNELELHQDSRVLPAVKIVKDTIVVVLEGGLVQSVVSDNPMPGLQVVVVDYDTDGADEDEVVHVLCKVGEGFQRACAHLTSVGPAAIDIQAIRKQLEV